MHTYHAVYHKTEKGWYVAKVLDFPGALSQGRTLRSARRMIRDALRMLAEGLMEEGRPLPTSNPRAKDRTADFSEAITLRLRVQCGTQS